MAEVSGGDMPESHNNRDDDLLDIVDDTEPPGRVSKAAAAVAHPDRR